MFTKKPPSINPQLVSRAAKSDYEPLANFFNQNPCIHRHLDWFSPLEWLGQQPFLLEKENEQVQAVFCAVPENKEIAWVRVFGLCKSQPMTPTWEQMLSSAIQDLQKKKVHTLASLSLHAWFKNLLEGSGFNHSQDIVVLEWQGQLPHQARINDSIEIRKMLITDLPEVDRIDQQAFPPLWQNAPAGLSKAFNQTGISTVAVKNHRIVGYQISTAMTIYGHLARLAVDPECQREGIAFTLVYDLLQRFERRGFLRVTVNTQSDNRASLKLYDRFGFQATGEKIPVYCLTL